MSQWFYHKVRVDNAIKSDDICWNYYFTGIAFGQVMIGITWRKRTSDEVALQRQRKRVQ